MSSKKKIIGISLAAVILVAIVTGVTVGLIVRKNQHKADEKKGDDNAISTSAKAVEAVCSPTDHKDICMQTLTPAAGNITDPQELIKIAFNIAIKQIQDSDKSSSQLFSDIAKDPATKGALDVCTEVAQKAIRDLNRTVEHIGTLDLTKVDEIAENMKTWLSASRTYEETCLDAFQHTSGDAGQKMKDHMKSAIELTENTLAMVSQVSSALSSLGFKRRLLSTNDGLPTWASASARKLLTANPKTIKPDLVVAKDGSGQFKTVVEAINSIPKVRSKTFVLYIKAGVYVEQVVIPEYLNNLVIMGDGPTKTKISGSLNMVDGTQTYNTAPFATDSSRYMQWCLLTTRNMGFENTAGPEKHQAVAARISADFAAFQNCRFDGHQDTLYAHSYRQYYSDCTITGTIDFICGDSAVVLQPCDILFRKGDPDSALANVAIAQARVNPKMPSGMVIQNCTFKADPQNPPDVETINYLARPWKEYSRTIIMESFIGKIVDRKGYKPWMGSYALNTLFYAEYNNRGPKSGLTTRIKWKNIHNIKKEVAEMFTASKFVKGDSWIPATGVPYNASLLFPAPVDAPNALGLNQVGENLGTAAPKEAYGLPPI